MMFPELRNMLDEDLQSRCVQLAWARVARSLPRESRTQISVVFVFTALAVCVGLDLPWCIGVASSYGAYGLAAFLFYCWQRKKFHHFLKQAIRELSECCAACGYDVRGLKHSCPECGSEIEATKDACAASP